jgi:hypothetical protein
MTQLLKDFPSVHAEARAIKPHVTRFLAMIESGHCTWEELLHAAENIFVMVEPICDQFMDPINEGDMLILTGDSWAYIPGPPLEPPISN